MSDESAYAIDTHRYAKCVAVSQPRWCIDRDMIRGRRFDFNEKFLLDSLSLVARPASVCVDDKRLLSQMQGQGRMYATMLPSCERFIGAGVLDHRRSAGAICG